MDIPLIEYAASKGKPMVISCGMGTVEEIQDAVDACHRMNNDQIVLLKCTSEYPRRLCGYEYWRTMADMRERFGCTVGLSDHSMGWTVDVAAAALGASVIEKHFCITRAEETVDSAFSMDCEEFKSMIEAVRCARDAVGHVTYERTPREEENIAGRRSLYAVAPIHIGDTFYKTKTFAAFALPTVWPRSTFRNYSARRRGGISPLVRQLGKRIWTHRVKAKLASCPTIAIRADGSRSVAWGT